MAPSHPTAKPRFGTTFDPWNSSSTGHQRAEGRGGASGTAWRDDRNRRLNSQFGARGTKEAAGPAEGAGAAPPPARLGFSVMEMLANPGLMRAGSKTGVEAGAAVDPESMTRPDLGATGGARPGRGAAAATESQKKNESGSVEEQISQAGRRHIFDSLVFYINGSTFPLVSDHRLKQILVENGAHVSSHLARRQVTHVILGRRAGIGRGAGKGAGGGALAAGKLEREIRRIGGRGVKYVGAEWVLESIKAGQRLPEARFAGLRAAAAAAQQGALGFVPKKRVDSDQAEGRKTRPA